MFRISQGSFFDPKKHTMDADRRIYLERAIRAANETEENPSATIAEFDQALNLVAALRCVHFKNSDCDDLMRSHSAILDKWAPVAKAKITP